MKFKAKIWEQGASLLVTIPAHIVNSLGLNANDITEIEILKPLSTLCLCGNLYRDNEKADHECTYAVFNDSSDAVTARYLLNKLRGEK